MTTDPYRPSTGQVPETGSPTAAGQVEVLDRESRWVPVESLLHQPLAGVWLRLGPRTRATATVLALLAGLAVLTHGGAAPQPHGEPASTTSSAGSPFGTTSDQGADQDGGVRAAAVATWVQAQHAWAAGDLATLCRSFTGVGTMDPTPRGLSCKHLFSARTDALVGITDADRPEPDVQYRPEDAFVLSDQRTVLVYGRRVRSAAGRALDPGSSVVYVMRSVPRFGWRWVGTTDAESSVGWVPPGFPPVRA